MIQQNSNQNFEKLYITLMIEVKKLYNILKDDPDEDDIEKAVSILKNRIRQDSLKR